MIIRLPKTYGRYKIEPCPFCSKQATIRNKQGVPVCIDHKDKKLDNLKCVCGNYVDVMHGKYGVFFNCINCGNMTLKKVLEINKN